MCRGILIAIEGIDGAGKTTIAKMLVEGLRKMGIKAVYTYEPYDTPVAKLLEQLLGKISPTAEALMLAADRVIHVDTVILPSLKRCDVVITDRYFYSSMAYQGARGVDIEWIREINRFAPIPDIGIYLDIDVETALERLRRKGLSKRWRYYEENIAILYKAREIYLGLASRGELMLFDAERPLKEVFTEVKNYVIKRIRKIS
ncbi:MAG: dTMP kinase [Thermoprotei archaeon]|nr:MAG: dTMP kinase [Thermoprotei archaeon]